jgi:hypothetical protein
MYVWELSHTSSQYSIFATISSTHSYIHSMPKAWVKDYVKQILIDAAERWILAALTLSYLVATT